MVNEISLVSLRGGLGNQLFQLAFLLSRRKEGRLFIEPWFFNDEASPPGQCGLWQFSLPDRVSFIERKPACHRLWSRIDSYMLRAGSKIKISRKINLFTIEIIGSFIGLIGIVLLILLGKNSAISGDFKPILAVICATFLYGLSLNLIKHKLSAFKPIEITSLSFTTLLIPSIIGFFYFDTPETIMHNHDASHALIFITILAVIGTAMAVFLFNGIIKISSALFASSVTYFIPIVAVIIGFLMKEKITSNQIMAMIIVLLGVLLIHHGDKFVKRGVDSKTRSN